MKKTALFLTAVILVAVSGFVIWGGGYTRQEAPPLSAVEHPTAAPSEESTAPPEPETEPPPETEPDESSEVDPFWKVVPEPGAEPVDPNEASSEPQTLDGAPVTSVALSLESPGGKLGGTLYDDPAQVAMFLQLLPIGAESIEPASHTAGASPVLAEVTTAGSVLQYRYYPQDYVTETAEDGSVLWFSATEGTYSVLRDAVDWDGSLAAPAFGSMTFLDERVTAVYSYNRKERCYHDIGAYAGLAELLPQLESLSADPGDPGDDIGFLIVTDQANHNFYLKTASSGNPLRDSLASVSAQLNGQYPRRAQWLVDVRDESVTAIAFSAQGGYGYSNRVYAQSQRFVIELRTKDPDSIHRILRYLRFMEVGANPTIYNSPQSHSAVPDLFRMTINYGDGLQYYCFGTTTNLTVHANSRSEDIGYTVTASQTRRLRDIMAGLPETVLVPPEQYESYAAS